MEEVAKLKITGNEPVTPHLTYNQTSGNANGFVEGMTLRQLFATNAQKAIVSNAQSLIEITKRVTKENVKDTDDLFYKVVAGVAVAHADALIEALNK